MLGRFVIILALLVIIGLVAPLVVALSVHTKPSFVVSVYHDPSIKAITQYTIADGIMEIRCKDIDDVEKTRKELSAIMTGR